MFNSIKLTIREDAILKLMFDYAECENQEDMVKYGDWTGVWRKIIGSDWQDEIKRLKALGFIDCKDNGAYCITELGKEYAE